MTKFITSFKHEAVISKFGRTLGANFKTIKNGNFVIVNPEHIWYAVGGDYDDFVKKIIRVNLTEFLCAETLIPLEKTSSYPYLLKEGLPLRCMSLCQRGNKVGFLESDCGCKKTAIEMLGDDYSGI